MTVDPDIHGETFAYFHEKAPVLLFILSREGNIIDANRYAKDLIGRPLVGELFRDIVVDFTGKFDPIAAGGHGSTERLINIGTASGLPQSFYFTFQTAGDPILAFGRLDAEELENMRREVLSLNQELNNLMRELHRKNAQLKRLNAEKNRFLGMAAHDLRKPIGLIMTYSEFLMEETQTLLDPEHTGFVNTINASAAFMKRLVDDFLDVSAIEAGKFEMDLQPAAIEEVLYRSLQLNSLQATKKGIELETRCENGLPRIAMDAPKVEQAITNLVSNAIEHTRPNSQVTVAISCDQEFITFSVKDQGPGIPLEEQAKVFNPFGKTSVKKTGGEKSTGLGMVITRKIIEAHKGHIWFDSRMGDGTTVYFNLPIGVEKE